MSEGIQAGATNLARLKRFHKCRLIDNFTACHVDQNGGRFHLSERVLVDQVPRLRG